MSDKPQSQPGWSNISIERTPQKSFIEASQHDPIADESRTSRFGSFALLQKMRAELSAHAATLSSSTIAIESHRLRNVALGQYGSRIVDCP